MGNKDKSQKRLDRKMAKLEEQMKRATPSARSPAVGPAKSPLTGPSKLKHEAVPFEKLPFAALGLVARFAYASPKDGINSMALLSRTCYFTCEAARHHHSKQPVDVANDVVATWRASLGMATDVPRYTDLRDVTEPTSPANVAMRDAVPAEVLQRIAFALVKQGRSVLHAHFRQHASQLTSDWIVDMASGNGFMTPATKSTANGRTLVHYACRFGDRALATRLVKLPTFDPLVVDDMKRTALHVAAEENLTDVALLVVRRCDPAKLAALAATADVNKRTPIDAATHARHSRMATTLRELLAPPQDDEDYDEDDYEDDYDGYDE